MTIKECLEQNGLQTEVDYIGHWSAVDVDFTVGDIEDETSFDICDINTKTGEEELETLFEEFCKENGFSANSVTSITVVATADTKEELEELTP